MAGHWSKSGREHASADVADGKMQSKKASQSVRANEAEGMLYSGVDVVLEPGASPAHYWTVSNNGTSLVEGGVPVEAHVSIYVNGQELATLMCSPTDQEALALGFLRNEGIIESLAEVGLVQCNVPGTTVDVMLHATESPLPRRMILTSGCGGGLTFQAMTDQHPPLRSDFKTSPQTLALRMRDLNLAARLYRQVRGVHTSVLADEGEVLLIAEDVGRHNTIDKLAGKALMAGVPTQDRMIITSGRISSEMLMKARRMGVPLVASRTAPTSVSVSLAQAWQICVVGYLRQGGMRVYTCPERLGLVSE